MNVAQNSLLVVDIKDKEMNPDSKYDSENIGKRQIIDANPIAIVTTTSIQPEEPTDPEKGSPFSFTYVGEGDPASFYC